MDKILILFEAMKSSTNNVRFLDLKKVCDHYFGSPRQKGSSHCVYKTSWVGDPRVNIQNDRGKAKPYQVRQVIKAVERIKKEISHD